MKIQKKRRPPHNPADQDLIDLTIPNCVIINLAAMGIFSMYLQPNHFLKFSRRKKPNG